MPRRTARLTCHQAGNARRDNSLTKADKRKYGQNDYNSTNDINDIVHQVFSCG